MVPPQRHLDIQMSVRLYVRMIALYENENESICICTAECVSVCACVEAGASEWPCGSRLCSLFFSSPPPYDYFNFCPKKKVTSETFFFIFFSFNEL